MLQLVSSYTGGKVNVIAYSMGSPIARKVWIKNFKSFIFIAILMFFKTKIIFFNLYFHLKRLNSKYIYYFSYKIIQKRF